MASDSERSNEQRLDYMLLTSINKDELNRKVSQALRDGYKLHGSPVINLSNNKNIYFAQAVIWTNSSDSFHQEPSF
ncbi:DUF1737 domain-containing protein [Halotalea alkalilenta]|uniref:DUF1737 domain-containing protein n=1 Tax=Halotalea alkalilenta TaxID=376489 RepID=UPI0005BB5F82|nr:DUF1737 domain-containing protein [Halotalea alkalilenta]